MTDTIPRGTFSVTPGIRLIPGQAGGIVLQPYPLRALRVNETAFKILIKCQEGIVLEEHAADAAAAVSGSALPFLDALCRSGVLRWKPLKDGYTPFVSVIIPVYNRAHEIGDCIESLLSMDYPPASREIIVVDDGSTDRTLEVVRRYPVVTIAQDRNRGQSAARNVGVRAARGEIVALIDSDCIADRQWLRDLVPYFIDRRIVLVGGFVASFYRESRLDRYEDVKSPLNMGARTVIGQGEESDFYVPTCNMLVRKAAYLDAGGLDEAWRVGEDVDLCWKLKQRGHRLIYVPEGIVSHKHRNRFLDGFKRRFDYGTSEPLLYRRYPAVGKRFPRQPLAMSVLFCCCLGLVARAPIFFGAGLFLWLGDAFRQKMRLEEKTALRLGYGDIFKATFRSTFSLSYYLSLHVVRYHLLAITALTLLFSSLTPLTLAICLLPVLVEFNRTRPRLAFPVFLVLFWMEQIFYAGGVLWSSLKTGCFRCYRLELSGSGKLRKEPQAGNTSSLAGEACRP